MSVVVRSPILLALLALGCDGALRFDEGSGDAGSDGCVAGVCGWRTETCDVGLCPMTCASGMTCTGTCGASCSTKCEEQSRCTLTAGESASIACEPMATCDLTLGPSGSVDCETDSTCVVRCSAGCSLTCHPGASCQIQCGTLPATTVVASGQCS